MKELYIIRHGETDYNRKGIVQGAGVDSSLNARGQRQAKSFYDSYKDHTFDAVYASALQRTHQTLAGFEEAGYVLQKTAELNEISWGDHEGKHPTNKMGRDFRTMVDAWHEGMTHLKTPNGESPDEVSGRLEDFLDRLATTKDKKILICCHGRTIRILLCALLTYPLKKMNLFSSENVCLHRLDWNPPEPAKIILLNNKDHLKTKL